MEMKPLQDVIICCTSVTQDDRIAIVRQAVEMGATIQADLTSDVTHLIVARVQTEKYKYAARHRTDLRLMGVEWIPAIHSSWLAGEDINLPWSEEKYRLQVFHGLRICVTNFETDMRSEIERIVTQNGATYTGDLTKENTHLIAGSASGKKWEAVNTWQCGMSIVGVEWIFESLRRGAALDEKYFRLELRAEVRGQSSWFPARSVPRIDVGSDAESGGGKRKRVKSEQVPRKRLSKRASTLKADGFWADLLVPSAESKEDKHEESTASNLSRNLFPTIQLDLPTVHQDPSSVETNMVFGGGNMLTEDMSSGIFDRRSFWISGFSQREEEIVRNTIVSNGGRIEDFQGRNIVAIVPQNGNPPNHSDSEPTVTEYWLERCLSLHKFEDPNAHFLSTPFTASLPISKMDQLSICTSGFSALESMHIEKMVKKVGAIYCETLTKGRSILLAASRECRKFRLAKDNGTRVIRVEWLWECIRQGKMAGVTDYALDGVLGSQCRIDGALAIAQRRRGLMQDVVCYLGSPDNGDSNALKKMLQTMSARITTSELDSALTHYISDWRPIRLRSRSIHVVSPTWISESYALSQRQPESSYLVNGNDENVPPGENTKDKPVNAQNLALEMNEIRQRLSSGAARRASRKLLGRATTLPCVLDEPMMLITDEDETLNTDTTARASFTQGITYSDPDAIKTRESVLAKLGAATANSTPDNLSDFDNRVNMRAVGLDDTRKLRR